MVKKVDTNQIGYEGAMAIGKTLKGGSRITHLYLSKTFCKDR